MKRLTLLFLSIVILAGCSTPGKSAEQQGHGISIEMSNSLDIKHMTLIKYVNGREVVSENVINADNSSFKKGDITWFDISPSAESNTKSELAISYDENLDGTNAHKTETIDISNANEWVNVEFTKDFQLRVIDMK